jgi:YHS domain-containing protein
MTLLRKRNGWQTALGILIVVSILVPATAMAVEPINSSFLRGAIKGYDPVAYFTQDSPAKGRSAHSHEWMDATWYFANAENMELFASDPEKYAPQYGGYCAYAVSQGYTAKIDPDAWKIVDDKLYLNFSLKVQKIWEKDIPGYIAKADVNWPNILSGE